jgi:hypothetical protein
MMLFFHRNARETWQTVPVYRPTEASGRRDRRRSIKYHSRAAPHLQPHLYRRVSYPAERSSKSSEMVSCINLLTKFSI